MCVTKMYILEVCKNDYPRLFSVMVQLKNCNESYSDSLILRIFS